MPGIDESTFLQAAQYVYDNKLSQPYTNTSFPFDWAHATQEHGVIPRPNHGLAHSMRGAMYAPTVCRYFKEFAKDKENFQFTMDEVKKIQIALLFRVAGRENDAGYADDPVAYQRYQKQHAQAFRDYCDEHPGIFTEQEKERYANALETYANPSENDPLKIIFKACHNLDLLRCCPNSRLEQEFEPMRVQLGDRSNDLIVYADNCIRQTGDRILDDNLVTRKLAQGDYDDSIFGLVSTDVNACAKAIAKVPKPKDMYYQRAKDVRWRPTKQSEFRQNLNMAAQLGHKNARRLSKLNIKGLFGLSKKGRKNSNPDSENAIDLSYVLGKPKLNLGKPSMSIEEIGKIKDEWGREDEVIAASNPVIAKVGQLKKLLNDNMTLPNPLAINVDGKIYSDDAALLQITKGMMSMTQELSDLQGHATTAHRKGLIKNAVDDMAFIVKAVANQASGNNNELNTTLSALHTEMSSMGVEPKTTPRMRAESAKTSFLAGRATDVVQKLEQLSPQNRRKRALTAGPLQKNEATKRYEELMTDMLNDVDFEAIKINGGHILKFENGNEYNLTELLKNANLNHLVISPDSAEKYIKMVSSDSVVFPPCSPNPIDPTQPIAAKGVQGVQDLDAQFLQNDPDLNTLSQAERMAVNIYSTGFYDHANTMLREGSFSKEKDKLKELVCGIGMSVSALNKIDKEVPAHTFRGEKELPDSVLQKRIDAAEQGGITIESGFISTSTNKPDPKFAFKNAASDDNVGIVFSNLRGKNVKNLSAFPNEREFLLPPTQVKWDHYLSVKGGHIFTARPAATPGVILSDSQDDAKASPKSDSSNSNSLANSDNSHNSVNNGADPGHEYTSQSSKALDFQFKNYTGTSAQDNNLPSLNTEKSTPKSQEPEKRGSKRIK